jgi:hypothetical protein
MKGALSLPNLIKASMKFQSAVSAQQNPSLLTSSRLQAAEPRRSYYRDITEEGQDAMAVTPTAIRNFLTTQSIDFKQGFTCYSAACTQCRKCRHLTAGKAKILINTTTGSFVCTECTWSGLWKGFEETVDAFRHVDLVQLAKLVL